MASHVIVLKWGNKNDTSSVSRGVNKVMMKPFMQRTVLSYFSSIFDPIGLVGFRPDPVAGHDRLLLKDVWRVSSQKWDETFSGELQKNFLEMLTG